MGMDQAKPPQGASPEGEVVEGWDDDLFLVTNDDMCHLTDPVEHNTDLATEITGERGKLPAELKGHQLSGGNSPPK
ncbi:MAG: hypothetical protein Fur0034_20350 [Desulfuromonadia bacterium]